MAEVACHCPNCTEGKHERPVVALGFTTERAIPNLIFLRWVELLRAWWWPGPIFYARGAPGFAAARNIVMDQAWAASDSWDSLLFWDSDQLPPLFIPTIERMVPLLEFLDGLPDLDVIAGLYFSRDTVLKPEELPHEPVAYESWPAQGDEPAGFRRLNTNRMRQILSRRGLSRVGAAGTGSMLIRRRILERLREAKGDRPLFEQPQLSGRQKAWQWTEDLYFCQQIQELLDPPAEIWLDSRLESAHQGDLWVSSQHYLAVRGMARRPEEAEKPSRLILPGRR